MDSQRRTILTAFVRGVVMIGAGVIAMRSNAVSASPSVDRSQQQATVPPPHTDRPLMPPAANPPTSAQLRQNQRDIRKDVDQLFSLAQDLKTLAEKNDAAVELSVNLIQKTEDIEKLAKKIRDLARN